jgi:hypothetical protein
MNSCSGKTVPRRFCHPEAMTSSRAGGPKKHKICTLEQSISYVLIVLCFDEKCVDSSETIDDCIESILEMQCEDVDSESKLQDFYVLYYLANTGVTQAGIR